MDPVCSSLYPFMHDTISEDSGGFVEFAPRLHFRQLELPDCHIKHRHQCQIPEHEEKTEQHEIQATPDAGAGFDEQDVKDAVIEGMR